MRNKRKPTTIYKRKRPMNVGEQIHWFREHMKVESYLTISKDGFIDARHKISADDLTIEDINALMAAVFERQVTFTETRIHGDNWTAIKIEDAPPIEQETIKQLEAWHAFRNATGLETSEVGLADEVIDQPAEEGDQHTTPGNPTI